MVDEMRNTEGGQQVLGHAKSRVKRYDGEYRAEHTFPILSSLF